MYILRDALPVRTAPGSRARAAEQDPAAPGFRVVEIVHADSEPVRAT